MTSNKDTISKRHYFATAAGVVLCIVLIPLLVINVTLIMKSFTQPEKVPDFLGYKPFIVLSGSMEPAIMTGDLVITQEVDPKDLKEGDVIAYRYAGQTVITHRIQQVTEKDGLRAFITKGDANNVEDNVIPTEDLVEGRLRWTVPGVGDAAMFLQTPYGLLLAAGVPLFLFLLVDLLRRRHKDGHEKTKTQALEEELERMKQKLAEGGTPPGSPEQGGDTNHKE